MTVKSKKSNKIYDIINEQLIRYDCFRNVPFVYYYEGLTISGEKILYKKVSNKILTNSIVLIS